MSGARAGAYLVAQLSDANIITEPRLMRAERLAAMPAAAQSAAINKRARTALRQCVCGEFDADVRTLLQRHAGARVFLAYRSGANIDMPLGEDLAGRRGGGVLARA